MSGKGIPSWKISIVDICNTLERRYNPENDLAIPAVSYTESRLVDIIRILADKVDDLDREVATLRFGQISSSRAE